MKRGIIASPAKMQRQTFNDVTVSSNITIQDLYYYILYYDKVVLPTNGMIHYGIPHEDMLISENIVSRPRVNFHSWSTSSQVNLFLESQKIVANDLIKNEKDVDWILHQIGEELILGDRNVKEFNSLKVEINECLPVPTKETSVEDIIDFKRRRQSELDELHETLDLFYFEIINSSDKDFQSKKSLSKLKKALTNVNQVSNEKFSHSSKYNLVTELNFGSLITGLTSGATLGFMTNPQIIPLTSIIGAALSFISIKANKTISVEEAKEKLKLSYLASAKKDKII
jgi:hypothetical protein